MHDRQECRLTLRCAAQCATRLRADVACPPQCLQKHSSITCMETTIMHERKQYRKYKEDVAFKTRVYDKTEEGH